MLITLSYVLCSTVLLLPVLYVSDNSRDCKYWSFDVLYIPLSLHKIKKSTNSWYKTGYSEHFAFGHSIQQLVLVFPVC